MPTKAEQFRYSEQRDPKNKKKAGPHVKRTSRMSKRTTPAGAPAHDNVRAGKKAVVRKESGSRKSARRSKKGLRVDSNLERRTERAQRAPTTRARRAKAGAVRPRGGSAPAASRGAGK